MRPHGLVRGRRGGGGGSFSPQIGELLGGASESGGDSLIGSGLAAPAGTAPEVQPGQSSSARGSLILFVVAREANPPMAPSFMDSRAELGTITIEPFSFRPSKSMFIPRSWSATGLSW